MQQQVQTYQRICPSCDKILKEEYDTIRQKEITERLGCEFHIIWE